MRRHSRAWHDMHDGLLAERAAQRQAEASLQARAEETESLAPLCGTSAAPAPLPEVPPAPRYSQPSFLADKNGQTRAQRRREQHAHGVQTGNFDD